MKLTVIDNKQDISPMNLRIVFFLFFFIHTDWLLSQPLSIGQWRDHFPYNKVKALTESPDKIYCATDFAIFSYNKTDNSIERISIVNGLSEVDLSTLLYHTPTGILIVGYESGNIDLVDKNSVVNIGDITRKNIYGDKTIYRIIEIGSKVYLACGFGIVLLDVSKKEIKETYFIGSNGSSLRVNALASDGNMLFAATDDGIYKAPLNSSDLTKYDSWTKDQSPVLRKGRYRTLLYIDNKLYAGFKSTGWESDTIFVYENNNWSFTDKVVGQSVKSIHARNNRFVVSHSYSVDIYDMNWNRLQRITSYNTKQFPMAVYAFLGSDNTLWIADYGWSKGDYGQGLIKYSDSSHIDIIIPNGPESGRSFNMSVRNNHLWVATGYRSRSNGNNTWQQDGIMAFRDEKWVSLNKRNIPALDTIWDFCYLAIDPLNYKHVAASSLSKGIIEIMDEKTVNIYTDKNSPVTSGPTWLDHIGSSGLAFDNLGNLWATVDRVENAICERKANGEWVSYKVSSLSNQEYIGNMLITRNGDKWVALPKKGIVVFNEKGTINTNMSKLISEGAGKGGLYNNFILSMAEDLDGKIWLGTSRGIEVIFSPGNVFGGGNYDAQRILIKQDGYNQYLLETESVLSIAVDGANRKWMGTSGAGVFLISEDGTKQLMSFNVDNSPLPSNQIDCIAVNSETGEVFFGTEKGIISYRSDATEGKEDFEDVYAFPNPVKSGYDGPIAIKGLVRNANVKITDVSGALVFETTALGGQAIWNAKDFNGNRVSTGVYLAFISNADGSKNFITKILVGN